MSAASVITSKDSHINLSDILVPLVSKTFPAWAAESVLHMYVLGLGSTTLQLDSLWLYLMIFVPKRSLLNEG